MTRVADTNVLYALFDEDDAHHDGARDLVADPEPVEIPREVLVETVDLIAYRATFAAASRALVWLLERGNLRVAEPVHVPAVRDLYEEARGKLSLADAVVVQTCRALGAQPLAYDQEIVDRV